MFDAFVITLMDNEWKPLIQSSPCYQTNYEANSNTRRVLYFYKKIVFFHDVMTDSYILHRKQYTLCESFD